MTLQTVADIEREAERGAETALQLWRDGKRDRAVYQAWLAVCLFGAVDELRRRGRR